MNRIYIYIYTQAATFQLFIFRVKKNLPHQGTCGPLLWCCVGDGQHVAFRGGRQGSQGWQIAFTQEVIFHVSIPNLAAVLRQETVGIVSNVLVFGIQKKTWDSFRDLLAPKVD